MYYFTEDEGSSFSRSQPQRASLRVTGSRSMLSVNNGHMEEPVNNALNTSSLSNSYYSGNYCCMKYSILLFSKHNMIN